MKFGLVFFFSFQLTVLLGQTNYKPRETHPPNYFEYLRAIRNQFDNELESMGVKNRAEVNDFNDARKEQVKRYLNARMIIKDDTLQTYVRSIIERLVKANRLPIKPRSVLILKDPTVNAISFGGGVFVVNIGLLGRMHDEHELAFILAHELAHDELHHAVKGVLWQMETDFSKSVSRQVAEIRFAKNPREHIQQMMRLFYGKSALRREREREADSLGVIFMQRAGYADEKCLTSLDVLDHRDQLKHKVDFELFLPLHCDEYPFRDDWVHGKRTVTGNEPAETDTFRLVYLDSLHTHPEIEKRKEAVSLYLTRQSGHDDPLQRQFAMHAIRTAEFETIEAHLLRNDQKNALVDALVLFTVYPHDRYLALRIASLLVSRFQQKRDNLGSFHVPRTKSPEAILVYDLVNNLTTTETGEVAYFYLKNPRNFPRDEPLQQHLLWKVCEWTNRREERKQIADQFLTRYKIPVQDYEPEITTGPAEK